MGRIEGGGWVHQKSAKCMTTSGLGCRNDLIGTERTMELETSDITL